MVEVLSRLRDCNLHYKINDDRVRDYYFRRAERKTGFMLRDVLKASPRKIKERYKGMALLDQKSMEFLLKDNYVRQGRKFVFNKHCLSTPKGLLFPLREPSLRMEHLSSTGSPESPRCSTGSHSSERCS
jgi:hypothetical protein